MKRSYFLTVVAAALLGGQAFADFTLDSHTGSNVELVGDSWYYGVRPETGTAEGGYVKIFYSEDVSLTLAPSACGGYGTSSVCNNKVVVESGDLADAIGGEGKSTVYNNKVVVTDGSLIAATGGRAFGNLEEGAKVYGNTVIMAGGSAGRLTGGRAYPYDKSTTVEVYGNRVYITGGEMKKNEIVDYTYVWGGSTTGATGDCHDNQVHLVGANASVTVDGVTYEGHEMQMDAIVSGGEINPGSGTSYGNSIEIYGRGISTTSLASGTFQSLNFHIADFEDASTMLTLTGDTPLDFAGVELTFDALEDVDKLPGTSVTLVSSMAGFSNFNDDLRKEYTIYRKDSPDTVVGTATLILENGENTTQDLKLVYNGYVPERGHFPTAANVELVKNAHLNGNNDGMYIGKEASMSDATKGYVEVCYSPTGYIGTPDVIGGITFIDSANENKVVVTGGDLRDVVGGWAEELVEGVGVGDVCDNTVIMTGGSVRNLYGGYRISSSDVEKEVSGNRVYITGGTAEYVLGGQAVGINVNCLNNQVHLVGAGASVTVDGVTYEGHEMQLNAVVCGATELISGQKSGNSIEIYGSDITTARLRQNTFQILSFHIADFDDAPTMLTLTDAPLDLTDFLIPTEETPTPELALTFDALDSLVWKPNATVTLVGAEKGINGLDPSLLEKEYNIYRNGDPSQKVLGTATLKLEQGEGTTQYLKLVTNENVPEPTTGTLGLLALCALAARRRK